MRHGAKNVQHGAKNVRHCVENVRYGAKNVQHGALIPQSPNPQTSQSPNPPIHYGVEMCQVAQVF